MRWYDNRQVQCASNCAHIEPLGNVQGWSGKDKKYIDVPRPHVVSLYNGGMGGVKLFDMFMALYHLNHRSKQGYMRVFFWILAISVTNAWCLYRCPCIQDQVPASEQLDLLNFTSDVAASLVKTHVMVRQSGRPSSNGSPNERIAKRPRKAPTKGPNDDIRYDGVEHWPVYGSERPRCAHCGEKNKTSVLEM